MGLVCSEESEFPLYYKIKANIFYTANDIQHETSIRRKEKIKLFENKNIVLYKKVR